MIYRIDDIKDYIETVEGEDDNYLKGLISIANLVQFQIQEYIDNTETEIAKKNKEEIEKLYKVWKDIDLLEKCEMYLDNEVISTKEKKKYKLLYNKIKDVQKIKPARYSTWIIDACLDYACEDIDAFLNSYIVKYLAEEQNLKFKPEELKILNENFQSVRELNHKEYSYGR